MRLVHKATDELSESAQRLMLAGFRAKKTYAAIARDLAAIGEQVAERTIARRGAEFRAEERRRQETREWAGALVDAAKSSPEASEIVKALATDALLTDPDAFTDHDPVKVQRLNLRAEELRLKRDANELKRRELELNEKKFEVLREREERAKAALEKPDAQMTPEQRIREIEEIYGIKRRPNG